MTDYRTYNAKSYEDFLLASDYVFTIEGFADILNAMDERCSEPSGDIYDDIIEHNEWAELNALDRARYGIGRNCLVTDGRNVLVMLPNGHFGCVSAREFFPTKAEAFREIYDKAI